LAEIITLSRARKARARAEKEAKAAEHRVQFGRTRAQRAAEKKDRARDRALLDGHRCDTDDEPGPAGGA
jgi:hypothetical protein